MCWWGCQKLNTLSQIQIWSLFSSVLYTDSHTFHKSCMILSDYQNYFWYINLFKPLLMMSTQPMSKGMMKRQEIKERSTLGPPIWEIDVGILVFDWLYLNRKMTNFLIFLFVLSMLAVIFYSFWMVDPAILWIISFN